MINYINLKKFKNHQEITSFKFEMLAHVKILY
jgi:hypothetical protein